MNELYNAWQSNAFVIMILTMICLILFVMFIAAVQSESKLKEENKELRNKIDTFYGNKKK